MNQFRSILAIVLLLTLALSLSGCAEPEQEYKKFNVPSDSLAPKLEKGDVCYIMEVDIKDLDENDIVAFKLEVNGNKVKEAGRFLDRTGYKVTVETALCTITLSKKDILGVLVDEDGERLRMKPDSYRYSGGKKLIQVQTDSMSPTLEVGAYYYTEEVDINTLRSDDIITYWTVINGERVLNTHRITMIADGGGYRIFQTKGDKNDTVDALTVHEASVVGKLVLD